MNANEFYTEFNLAYNNLASNQAPGLDRVEISIYLTKAQNMLIDALYGEFEKSEEARRKLSKLVTTNKLQSITVASDEILIPNTVCYSLPKNNTNNAVEVRYIINEQLKIKDSAKSCVKGQLIDVKPCLHDEVDNYIKNPYRFNIRRALRLDADEHIEILYKEPSNIDYYKIRYVKIPEPIMIYNTVDNPDMNDSIEGFAPTTTANSYRPASLPDSTHRQIVEIAAKMAYTDYKN